jgi:hypothetical protein
LLLHADSHVLRAPAVVDHLLRQCLHEWLYIALVVLTTA